MILQITSFDKKKKKKKKIIVPEEHRNFRVFKFSTVI